MSDNTLTFKLAGPSDIQAYRRIKMIINLVLSPYHATYSPWSEKEFKTSNIFETEEAM